MPPRESLRTRLLRWRLNFFPAYRRTGARVTFIAEDMHEVHVALPLNWQTRNYVGTTFGGSIYAFVDPIYMVMFIHLLGPGHTVWDKSARVEFKRPGRTTLRAEIRIEREELAEVRARLETQEKFDRTYRIEVVDEGGTTCAVVEKVIHFRRKRASSTDG